MLRGAVVELWTVVQVSGVVVGGGLSYHDCREIFRHQIEKVGSNNT